MRGSTDASLTPTRQFAADLARSGEVLVHQPMLPVLTLLLAVLTQYPLLIGYFDSWAQLISQLAWIVMAGWVGTQRIWFARAFSGASVRPRELASWTVVFIPRYFLLGLLVLFPNVAIVWIATRVAPDPRTLMTLWFVLPLIFFLTTDVLLTFVTPALAYSTSKLRGAMPLGLRMLRDEWPRCAWYALIPPLAVTLLGWLIPRSVLGAATGGILGITGFLVGLWFKGAIASYYLRSHPIEGSIDAVRRK